MNRDELRLFARNGWPVVQTESGAHGDIVYPYIREIKVIYASAEEIRRGYPRERLAVVLADRSGHSFTEVQARDLRFPTEDEANAFAMPFVDRRGMIAELAKFRETEEVS